jgi:hypothetical protein
MNSGEWNTAQVAAYLSCSEWKARRLLGDVIPARFDGRQWWALPSAVEDYREGQRRTGKQRRPKGSRGRGKSLGAPTRKAS